MKMKYMILGLCSFLAVSIVAVYLLSGAYAHDTFIDTDIHEAIELAQAKVDFPIVIPSNIPDDLQILGVDIQEPRFTAEAKKRDMTRVKTLFVPLFEDPYSFIEIEQTNHEMVPGDKDLEITHFELDGIEIGHYTCKCEDENKRVSTYFWNVGKTTTFLRTTGYDFDVIKPIIFELIQTLNIDEEREKLES